MVMAVRSFRRCIDEFLPDRRFRAQCITGPVKSQPVGHTFGIDETVSCQYTLDGLARFEVTGSDRAVRLRFRTLSDSDIKISDVGFGVWTVSTAMWGVTDHTVRLRLLRRALELGITFYDTADVYGDGTGETILAEAFQGKRDHIAIATK